MTDDTQQQEHHSRRFIKGVHRAFFSPVEPEDMVIPPQPVTQPVVQQTIAPPVQPVVAPIPVATPVQSVAAPIPAPQVQPVQQQVPPPLVKMKRKKSLAKFIFFMLLGLVISGVGGYSYYMYWTSQQQLAKLQQASPQAYVDLETEALVNKVGQHFLLPKETPLIRTLQGVDQNMRNEPFYVNAKDGDKVLVYSQRAILYDPSTDKIIEVGAVRPVTPTPLADQNATNSATPQVAGVSTVSGKILINNEK